MWIARRTIQALPAYIECNNCGGSVAYTLYSRLPRLRLPLCHPELRRLWLDSDEWLR